MMKRISLLLAGLLAGMSVFFTVWAVAPRSAGANTLDTDYRVIIRDDADLFSESEESALRRQMEQSLSYGNMALVTVPKGGNPYGNTGVYVDAVYGELIGYQVTGVLFCIDMSQREIYLYSTGALYDAITVNDCNAVTDNISSYASDGDYYGCARECFDEVYQYLESGKLNRPMLMLLVIFLSLFLAAFIAFLIMKAVMRLPSPSSAELAQAATTRFSTLSARSSISRTTRTYSPIVTSSSGSSGSSSGGGHSGGGFSGGGGGGFSGGGGHGGGHGF